MQAPYRPPAMRLGASSAEQVGTALQTARPASSSTTFDEDANVVESRLFRGRARAGTLPSSWNDVLDQQSTFPSSTKQSPGVQTGVIGDGSTTVRSGQAWNNSGTLGQESGFERPRQPPARSTTLLPNYAAPITNSTIPSRLLSSSRQVRSTTTGEFDRVSLYSHLDPNLSTSSSPYAAPAPFDGSEGTGSSSNRHRSGSLTNALAGLGNNAFGPSIFTSTWSDQPASNRLIAANRSQVFSTSPADDQSQPLDGSEGIHTLDYLGLDRDDSGNHRNNSTLGQYHMRNRASTMATFPPHSILGDTGSAVTPLTGLSQYEEEENSFDNNVNEDLYTNYTQGLDVSQLATMASAIGMQGNSTLHTNRHRAGTVAALGGPGGRQRIEQELMRMALLGNGTGLNGLGFNSTLTNLTGMSNGTESRYSKAPLEGFHLDISTPPLTAAFRSSPFHTSPTTPITLLPSGNKNVSGDEASYLSWNANTLNSNGAVASGGDNSIRTTNQTPSRSLWIGNLDSNTIGQELMRVFAPYGAIESLRLLPEKECGFVNFVEINDAVRAREDVLGRLGAKLENLGTGPGGTVRIGFGKIDSAPSHTSTVNKPASSQGVAGVGGTAGSSSSFAIDKLMSSMDLGAGQSAPMTPGGSEGVGPTRALWVGSIPSTVTPAVLLNIFQPFGPVESARILTHKNCGFINFERVDDAVRARKMLNGRDVLGSEVGAMRIGFAKVPTRNIESFPSQGKESGQVELAMESLGSLKGANNVSKTPEQQIAAGLENYRSNFVINLLNQKEADTNTTIVTGNDAIAPSQQAKVTTSASSSIVPSSDKGGVPLPPHMAPRADVSDLQLLMSQLSAGLASKDADVASVSEQRPLATYYMTIPLVSEVSSGRRFETSKLRETRKNIESGQLGVRECDQLAKEYLESIVDLASDYIGNTLVQKFFEHCSDQVKTDMLHRLAPHLAMTGCHKNGTWAAQKILDCCKSQEQIALIAQHLRPYIPGLLLDQFGNYVVQCCLPWKQPLNEFVFDAMVDRCWEIAQGRFGARSMRACLEKEVVTDQQRKRVAMAVILNSVPLATSPNGSILLTWLLDTSGLSKSYKLLAPRFSPHLTHLCTHKLASTPVLRLVNQTFELEASQIILNALFESSQDYVLEEIVIDQVHGSQFVTKVLASPSLTKDQRDQYSKQVRELVEKHRLVGVPAYRRLCEDLGLLNPTSNVLERGGPKADLTAYQLRDSPQPGLAPMPHDAFNPYWDGTLPGYRYQTSPGRANSLKR